MTSPHEQQHCIMTENEEEMRIEAQVELFAMTTIQYFNINEYSLCTYISHDNILYRHLWSPEDESLSLW